MRKKRMIIGGAVILLVLTALFLAAFTVDGDLVVNGILKLVSSGNTQEIEFGDSGEKLIYDPTNGIFEFTKKVSVNGEMEINKGLTISSTTENPVIQFGGGDAPKISYDGDALSMDEPLKVNGDVEVGEKIETTATNDFIIESGGDIIIQLGPMP